MTNTYLASVLIVLVFVGDEGVPDELHGAGLGLLQDEIDLLADLGQLTRDLVASEKCEGGVLRNGTIALL